VYKNNKEVVALEKSNELNNMAIGLFTNRSLCYFKKKLDANVIADATYVIENLSKKNVKAYYRRSVSYKNFGQYKDSITDLETILTFDPKNKDVEKELPIVKKLLEDDLKKQFDRINKSNSKNTSAPKASETNESKRPIIEEITEPIKPSTTTQVPEPKKKIKISNDILEKAAKKASEEIGKNKIKVPKTSYAFEADINSLKKNETDLYAYISGIPVETYSNVYTKIDIQADYLVIILESMNKFEENNDRILEVLSNIADAQNISMTMMFMNDNDLALVKQLMEKAEQSTLANKEVLLTKAKSILA